MWIFQNIIKSFQFFFLETKFTLFFIQSGFRSDTHNDLLAKCRRKRRYTEVILNPVKYQCHTSVLWCTLFGNVHSADDLDTCYDRILKFFRIPHYFLHRSVDSETHTYLIFQCLDMYITGTLVDRLLNDLINKKHNWGIVYFIISLVLFISF